MKLILILGSQAVGKMTVGQELTKITDLKLMHNHQMIEPVLEIFGEFNIEVILALRNVIFEKFLETNNEGLIFTMCMDFDSPFNWEIIEELIEMYEKAKSEIYIIELIASKEIRLERNKTENRLTHKNSKKNIKESEQRILKEEFFHRYESKEGEIPWKNHLKINNENLTAKETALKIKKYFQL